MEVESLHKIRYAKKKGRQKGRVEVTNKRERREQIIKKK